MPLNGSGTFSRLYNWVTDRNAGTKIQAARMDAEMDGMATALSTALYRDGQAVPTANLPMGGYKLTGLGDATSATDALNRQTADARYLASATATADLKALLDEAVHTITDVASASTCDIGAAATDRVRITGTTTITSFGTDADAIRFVHFAGALTLTHNATSLILPTGANITTAAGDAMIASSDSSGNWRVLSYQKADGTALVAAGLSDGGVTLAKLAPQATATILANVTGGSASPTAASLSAVLDLVGSAAQGDILYRNGTEWTRLGAGTSGQVLRSGGAGANVSWTTPSSGLSAASQAEQEAASSTSVAVTPGRQQYHPSAVKAWVKFNSAGSVLASHNIASVTDVTTGRWTVNIATDFSSTSYVGIAMCGQAAAPDALTVNVYDTPTAGTFTVQARDSGGTQADPGTPDEIHIAFFGDQ